MTPRNHAMAVTQCKQPHWLRARSYRVMVLVAAALLLSVRLAPAQDGGVVIKKRIVVDANGVVVEIQVDGDEVPPEPDKADDAPANAKPEEKDAKGEEKKPRRIRVIIDGKAFEFDPTRGDLQEQIEKAMRGELDEDEKKKDEIDERYVEASTTADNLLRQLRGLVASDDIEGAVELMGDVFATSPDAVLPDSEQGVLPQVRALIDSLPAELLDRYEVALAEESREALAAAVADGSAARLRAVALRYPRTPAARRAAELLWARLFEGGHMVRVIEQLDVYLTDTRLAPDKRRMGLLTLALASAQLGRRADAESALDRLARLPQASITFDGRVLNVRKTVEDLLAAGSIPSAPWSDVGGNAARNRRVAGEFPLAEPLVFSRQASGRVVFGSGDRMPSRRQLLEPRAMSSVEFDPERVALVGENAFLVMRGSHLVAVDRYGGGVLWERRLMGSGVPPEYAMWPSSGDGRVALVQAGFARRSNRGMRVMFGGRRRRRPRSGRRLVVLRETTGDVLWSWDGLVKEIETVQWTSEQRKAWLERIQAPAPEGTAPAAGVAAQDQTQLNVAGSPLVYGGRVFVGATKAPQGMLVESYLVCLDLATGEPLWHRFISAGSPVNLTPMGASTDRMIPTTDGRNVYVEGASGIVAAISLATAEVQWVSRLPWPTRQNAYYVSSSEWSGDMADAPIVVGDRLLVTELRGPGLVCLDRGTGKTLWKTPLKRIMRRLGVAQGMLLVSSPGAVEGYDVVSGESRLVVDLRGTVSGRGFVTDHAVYVPTHLGIERVDLASRKASLAYRLSPLVEPATALIPLQDGLLSSHADRVLVFGRVNEFFDGVKRNVAKHPASPQWRRRLGDLYCQSGDYARAEIEFAEALRLATRLEDRARSRSEQRLVYERMAWMYDAWGHALGDADRAVTKYETSLRYATTPGSQATAWLALAKHYETSGRNDEAADYYARVADADIAQRMFLATGTSGLEKTVASHAAEALGRVRRRTATAPVPAGVARSDLGRLAIHSLAMTSWSPPSYLALGSQTAETPLVWCRPDGLVAFGPRGGIRWRYTHAPNKNGAASSVLMSDGVLFDRRPSGVTAHRQTTGELLWQWQPPRGRDTADIDSVVGVYRGRMLRHRLIDRGVPFGFEEVLDPADPTTRDFVIAGNGVIVVSRTTARRGPVVHYLHRTTGREMWHESLPQLDRFMGIQIEGNRVITATMDSRWLLRLTCFDASSGRVLWFRNWTLDKRIVPRWIVAGGVLVYGGANGRAALDIATGDVIWEAASSQDFWSAGVPVAVLEDKVLFAHDKGYVAVSRDKGTFLWQHKLDESEVQGGPVEPPQIGGGRLYVPGRGGVTAISLDDGRLLWRHRDNAASPVRWRVFVTGDVVVAYPRKHLVSRLTFLDAGGGRVLGELPLGGAATVVRVTPMPRGLAVTNGQEMLVVAPRPAAPVTVGASH
jgi:outer membrane protein assembly factor BamB